MRKDALRLYIVRHGETAQNVKMAYLGISAEPLNDTGRRQAARAAEALSPLPLRLVVASPLRRTLDTAEAIAAAANVKLRCDERLREGSFGDWEGMTRDEVLARSPEDAALLSRWEDDPSVAPPGGESSETLQRRVVGLVEELAGEFPGEAVALVSHVGPIKALCAAALGIPLNASRRLFLDPGTISVVDWGAWPVIRMFNSHAHLGWTSARWMA
ncbi:MAG: histidine phosphatase family protein [Acidobacteriota bacterium]|jgi:probable phosphoglycerate mutase|nr:histidine phosphatase family protein [Acidobacteriota bacterium]